MTDIEAAARAEAEAQWNGFVRYARGEYPPAWFAAGAAWLAAQQSETRAVTATDAQVLAALNACDPRFATDNLSDYSPERVDDMRRAVQAAIEEGKN